MELFQTVPLTLLQKDLVHHPPDRGDDDVDVLGVRWHRSHSSVPHSPYPTHRS